MTANPTPAWLSIIAPGPATTVQDLGRFGWQSLGIPPAGALDSQALRLGNHLVGNPPTSSALEVRLLGPTLVVEGGPVVIALAGWAALSVINPQQDDQARPLAPWQSHLLHPGDQLTIGPLSAPADPAFGAGVAYLCLAGGIALEPILGSQSTYQRSALGGWKGRALQSGDRLPIGITSALKAGRTFAQLNDGGSLSQCLDRAPGPYRVILGPQAEAFSDLALETLTQATYKVTRSADRMGLRLEGPALAHRPDKGPDIVSDGLATGAIQVPGNGQPIILLADRQTVGGYTKIATVISADIPRLGHLQPGQDVRFETVTLTQAHAALSKAEKALATLCSSIEDIRPTGDLDFEALYQNNLISGVVSAL